MNRTGALALLAAAALTSAAVSSSASAATWLAVDPSRDHCGEKGCFTGVTNTFTRTFTAAEHRGGSITSLALFRSVMGELANHNVKIVFELPDGTEVTWGRWTVGMMSGDEFVTIGGEAVNWDAALGDLKVRLELFRPDRGRTGSGFGGGGGFDLGGPPAFASLPSADLPVDSLPAAGLDFTGPLVRAALPPQPIIAVPEPGAWALMILGFGGAGAMLRRRRHAGHPAFG